MTMSMQHCQQFILYINQWILYIKFSRYCKDKKFIFIFFFGSEHEHELQWTLTSRNPSREGGMWREGERGGKRGGGRWREGEREAHQWWR
jgi:hypothetical protein